MKHDQRTYSEGRVLGMLSLSGTRFQNFNGTFQYWLNNEVEMNFGWTNTDLVLCVYKQIHGYTGESITQNGTSENYEFQMNFRFAKTILELGVYKSIHGHANESNISKIKYWLNNLIEIHFAYTNTIFPIC